MVFTQLTIYLFVELINLVRFGRNSRQYKRTGDVFCLDEDEEEEEGARTLAEVHGTHTFLMLFYVLQQVCKTMHIS